MPTGTYPTRVSDFLAWSKKLVEQAAVSDRVHHKSSKGGKSSRKQRRKRVRRTRKHRKED